MAGEDHTAQVKALVGELNAATGSLGDDVFAGRNEVARQRALAAARGLITALENPIEAVFNTVLLAPPAPMCIRLAIDMRLFHIVDAAGDKGITAQELADQSGSELSLIIQIVRILTSTGFIAEADIELYKSSRFTKALTNPAIEATVRYCYDVGDASAVKTPEYFSKKGYHFPASPDDTPFHLAKDTTMGYFPWLVQHPDKLADFQTWMHFNQQGKPNWVDWFPVREKVLDGFAPKTDDDVLLVDIGGGQGHYLESFKSKFPDAKGRLVLQDLPDVVAQAKLSPGIETMGHDFFQEQPIKGARTYYFHWILHDWSDEAAAKILARVAAAMTPDSRLLLNETILPDKGCPYPYAAMGIMMMIQVASIERTRRQWTALLEGVGLKVVEFHDCPGIGEGIVEAVKA